MLQLIMIYPLPFDNLALQSAFGQGPVVIDFEDLSPSGPGTGASVFVNSQYASQGVSFNNPVALDYSMGVAIPGFAHSGTNAIETCFAQEFCAAPIAINFTSGQSHVKVWVGFSGSLQEDYPVIMRAFDSGGTEVGQATTTFAPSDTPRSIAVPLEVNTDGAVIVHVTVGPALEFPSQFSNGLALDDVEFSSAGPPPRSAADGGLSPTMLALIIGGAAAAAVVGGVLLVLKRRAKTEDQSIP
jgi:hypothetical protein